MGRYINIKTIEILKYCYKCDQSLSKSCFSKNRNTKDGLALPCKECVKKHDKNYYLKNKKKKILLAAKWASNNPEKRRECGRLGTKRRRLENLEKARKYSREWAVQHKYPHVKKAGHLVYKALKLGKLKKETCIICKKLYKIEKTAQAHHCDYNKPLEVMWLCPIHHSAWHRLLLPEMSC